MNSLDFQLAVDFHFVEGLDSYLPQLLILKKEKNQNCYFHKIVNEETLVHFPQFLDLYGDYIKTVQTIQIPALNTRFLKKNRPKKIKDINDLLSEPNYKRIVFDFIARQKAKLFDLLLQNPLRISLEFDKMDNFELHQIHLSETGIYPLPIFEKTPQGILYTLQLKGIKQQFYPADFKITTLLDEPGWIAINQTIYKIEHLNTNKLKPFLTKKTIEIPDRMVKTYFEKFIKEVVKKVDIVAKGFDIHTQKELTSVLLTPYDHFFQKRYVLQLQFQYGDIIFNAHERRSKHISLSVDNQDKVIIYETKRNALLEKKYKAILANHHLIEIEQGLFTFDESSTHHNIYNDIELLLENQDALLESGFTVPPFKIDQYNIIAKKPILHTQISEKIDWFDVQTSITCGTSTIPFIQLKENLLTGNPFFQLADGSYFLIPNEWFSKYKTFLLLANTAGTDFRIIKNQYPLLEVFKTKIAEKQTDKPSNNQALFTNTVKAQLRPYQKEGVQWLWEHYLQNTGACLADDMGLGKTLQCINLLELVKQDIPVADNYFPTDLFSAATPQKPLLQSLIVCPTSLVYNWQDEIAKFVPHWKILIYTGTNRKNLQTFFTKVDIVLTTYGIVMRDIDFFKTQSFNYVVADESQLFKNRDSKLYKSLNAMHTKNKIALSGTPIENSLSDLWSLMQFINPELLGPYRFFEKNFKIPIEKHRDDSVLTDLKKMINPFLLRRTKSLVLKDLPSLTEQTIKVDMSTQQHRLYVSEKSKARNFLMNQQENTKKLASIFKTLMLLRQISNHPQLIGNKADSGKFEEVSSYLLNLHKSGNKTLIFSFFSEHLKIYTQWCNSINIPFAHFDGSTTSPKRKAIIQSFKTDTKINLFFITTGSGGVGLNLTEATTVILLDPWWNPFKELQAIGRAHRIGQEFPVHVVRFISKDSIEEKILILQENKKLLSEELLHYETIPSAIVKDLDFVLK